MSDYALGATFDVKFTTRRFSSGVPFTLAGTPSIAAYSDNSTTQITAGLTLTVDFDAVTGLNNVRVVATSGNGYAAGSTYSLVLTAGTVDGISVVGEVIGSFTLERSAVYGRVGAPVGVSISADVAAVGLLSENLNTQLTAIVGYIDTEIAAIVSALGDGTSGLPALNTDLDTILTRLTALRAGYLDNLSAGAVGLEATLTAIKGVGWSTETLSAIKNALPGAVSIKRNVAINNFSFIMVDNNGVPLPNLAAVTAQRRLDGGAFAACANGVVLVGGGVYEINLAASDLNAITGMLKFSAAGAKTRYITFLTQP